VNSISHSRTRKNERGQILLMLAVSLPLLLLFLGLAIDAGFAYITKARLSKAVDAACLTAMKNLAQGTATATTLGTNSFNANYPTTSLDAIPPAVTIAFGADSSGNTLVNVTGTATINTFFIRLLPQFRTVPVACRAQATRAKLVMSVVLDRSDSMNHNGGSTALPPAVTSFVNYFDDTNDYVAMVSFASNATVDFPIGHSFKTPITNKVNAMTFVGGTFGPGGLTLAKAQNDSVVTTANIVKVGVYFTDGKVNIIQQTLSCNGTPTLYNLGGYDPNNTDVGFFIPTTGLQIYRYTPLAAPAAVRGTHAMLAAIAPL
jgi:Flp pilus assembly protein TadG